MQELVGDLRRVGELARERADSARSYSFGDRVLRIRGASDDLVAMPEGALVEVDAPPPGRQIIDLFVIDRDAADSVRFPSVALAAYGAVREAVASGWLVLHDHDTGRLLALDTTLGSALYHPGLPLPPRERAEFCRPLLHWLAVLAGNVALHAGAVARDGRAVIVAGGGNAGKTTLIRACLSAGFSMLGDNVVEVTRAETGPSAVVGVYPTVKVRPAPVVPIPPHWPESQWDDEARKDIYRLGAVLGDGFTTDPQDIAAILILDPDGPATPEPLSLSRAMFQVAPNTVGQFPLFEEQVLRRTGAVLARVPLRTVGKVAPSEIPRLLGDLLAGA